MATGHMQGSLWWIMPWYISWPFYIPAALGNGGQSTAEAHPQYHVSRLIIVDTVGVGLAYWTDN